MTSQHLLALPSVIRNAVKGHPQLVLHIPVVLFVVALLGYTFNGSALGGLLADTPARVLSGILAVVVTGAVIDRRRAWNRRVLAGTATIAYSFVRGVTIIAAGDIGLGFVWFAVGLYTAMFIGLIWEDVGP